MRTLGCATLVLAAALAGCDEPRPPSPKLWTLFDVQALYAAGAQETTGIARDAGLPGGVPLGTMLKSDKTTLSVQASFAEGYPAAYVTTEVWAYFDEVWAEPMYVPVTAWVNGMPPTRVVDEDNAWHPIFSVGPESLFYSPFWRMIEVKVPEGTEYDDLTSATQVIDADYLEVPSTGWVAALVPGDVVLDAPDPMVVGGALPGTGWLDGNPISFMKFPAAPFAADANQVVAEVPIFHFVFVEEDGTLVAPDIPSVLGTGPLYSNTAPPMDPITGEPSAKYSAYWRVYTVTVPANARVFAPPGSTADKALSDSGVSNDVPMYADEITMDINAPAVKDHWGRVAMAPGCFTTLADVTNQFNSPCKYLDSQANIEQFVPAASIVRTDITVTCPLVSVAGKAVKP